MNATTANSSAGVSMLRPLTSAAMALAIGSPVMEPDLSGGANFEFN